MGRIDWAGLATDLTELLPGWGCGVVVGVRGRGSGGVVEEV